jgi:hypothetical protein
MYKCEDTYTINPFFAKHNVYYCKTAYGDGTCVEVRSFGGEGDHENVELAGITLESDG